MKIIAIIVLLGLSLVSFAADLSGSISIQGRDGQATLAFGTRERQQIVDYYAARPVVAAETEKPNKHGKHGGLPPGLQKKVDRDGKLPPGLQKRLARGDSLPPGIEKRRLPATLEKTLPRLPPDVARSVIGVDVVLVNRKTGLVLDVIADIAR